MDSQTANQVLENALGNGSTRTSDLLKQWRNKPPEAQVLTARKMLHGVVTPALIDSGVPTEEVEAIFESIFQGYERASQRSGTRSTSST